MPKLIAWAPPWRWISRTTSSGSYPARRAIATRSRPAQSGFGSYRAIANGGPAVVLGELVLDRAPQFGAAGRVGGEPGEVVAVDPGRPVRDHHRRELGARGDVRILVGRDGPAGGAGRGDPLERRADRAPVRLAVGLEVRDVHGDVRSLADGDRLVDRRQQAGALVADVRGVDPAVPPHAPAPARSARRYGRIGWARRSGRWRSPRRRPACPARRAASSGRARIGSGRDRRCPGSPRGPRRAGSGG